MSKIGFSETPNRQCHICGTHLSRYNILELCWSCQEARRATEEHVKVTSSSLALLSPKQVLSSPRQIRLITQSILNNVRRSQPYKASDLGQFLKAYRSAHGLTQNQLAILLGFDQSYISKLENGQGLYKVTVLRDIADRLAIPSHLLVGLNPDDSTTRFSAELLEVAPSVIRLSQVVREAGRAEEALHELWPLYIRLEAHAAHDKDNKHLQLTLATGQTALGVILGDLLPEEDLYVPVRYLKEAASIVDELGSDKLKAEVHRIFGNELRKHKQFPEAIHHLEFAHLFSSDTQTKGLTAALLARTYGEMGDADHFDEMIREALPLIDTTDQFTATFHPVMIHEIHLRGLMSLGRLDKIRNILGNTEEGSTAFYIAPQWSTISQLTIAEAMLRSRKIDDGLEKLKGALVGAGLCKLPHQVQRAIRALKLVEVYDPAKQILDNAQMLLAKLTSDPSTLYSPEK